MRFILLRSAEEIRELIAWHNKNSSYVVIDTETTHKNPHLAELVDIQMSGRNEDEAVMFSGTFLPLLKDISTPLVFQNYKYDYIVCKRHGWDILANPISDTMIMSHLVDENRESHSLDAWVKEKYNDDYKSRFWSRYDSYPSAPESDRLAYGCTDIIYTRRLFEHLVPRIKEEGLKELSRRVHDFSKVLAKTEFDGIKVDLVYLAEKGVEIGGQIQDLLPNMKKLVELEASSIEMQMWEVELDKRKTSKGKTNVKKPEFNFDSSKQLCTLFYEHLGLGVCYNEKTRNPSVDDAALEKLSTAHPVVPLIQQYRGLKKVQGSFIDGTTERLVNDRIFPSFNINGTVTGRISSSSPNLQQLPREGGIRGIYIPDPGFSLISVDYSQLEVCLAAHFSQDKNLLKIVFEGASQHDITAESLKIPRQQAKTLNFAMQYRCSHYKVSKILGISENEAKIVWYRYWQTYSGLKRLMDDCDVKVDRGEPIINPFGRRRRFAVAKRNPWDSAYRQAFNALIQGTGADLTDFAAEAANQQLRRTSTGKVLFVVHDEIIATNKNGLDSQAKEIIVDKMVGMGKQLGLTVPLKVKASEGMSRWLD